MLKINLMNILLIAGLLAFSHAYLYGQDDSYYYGNQKIILTPATHTIAAVTIAPTSALSKYPSIADHLQSLSQVLGTKPDASVLFSTSQAGFSDAKQALAAPFATKELAQLPVYQVGEVRLIVQNELIVQFKDTTAEKDIAALLGHFSHLFTELRPGSNTYLVHVATPSSTLSIGNLLRNNHLVAFAEPNFLIIRPAARPGKHWVAPIGGVRRTGPLSAPAPISGAAIAGMPTDPLFPRQWALNNTLSDVTVGVAGADIGILKAWMTTRGSANIRVAVLDEQIDIQHPDLMGSLAMAAGSPVQWDAIQSKSQMPPTNTDTHGTEVAGVIVAQSNLVGLVGVAPQVKLVPIRMGSGSASPGGQWTTPAIVDEAIRKAVEFNADVINISWTMEPSDLVAASIRYAAISGRGGKGAVVVCASGDDGGDVVFPANLAAPGLPLLAVGASNSWDQIKTTTSKDGENWWASNSGPSLSLIAPGVGITTTTVSAPANADDSYVFDFNGTSSSAPLVSGAAALVLSIHPEWTASQVRDKLTSTAHRSGSTRTDLVGWGRLDVCRAVDGVGCAQ
jgi:thermitase